jgi:glycogen debranching enzyme
MARPAQKQKKAEDKAPSSGTRDSAAGRESQHQREIKETVLTHGTPSVARSIADAVPFKDEGLFLVAAPNGDIPMEGEHGFGLYLHDCRFLRGYALRVDDQDLHALVASSLQGFTGAFELTNPEISQRTGGPVHQRSLGVRWSRKLDGDAQALHDVLHFHNHGPEAARFSVTLSFRAAFEDVYMVRGLLREHPGKLHAPVWEDGSLRFVYDGADGLRRTALVHFFTSPARVEGTTAHFDVEVAPQSEACLQLSVELDERPVAKAEKPGTPEKPDLARIDRDMCVRTKQWREKHLHVRSSSLLVDEAIARSLDDLRTLRTPMDGDRFFAAGIPWFVALFGRDALLTALFMLSYEPGIAEGTLRLLARHQGTKYDAYRDEAPGKILHELRTGELARLGEIPHTPYYGTVDATALFLILLGRHAHFTGSLALFQELLPHVNAALGWIDEAERQGNGFIAYESSSHHGLINQGWKDSGDAIVDEDGNEAEPPIALVEVQGYTYMARLEIADLFERAGQREKAEALRVAAEDLRARFERDFWMPDRKFYALALMKGGRPARVVSSNPGQALWTGIASEDRARDVAAALFRDDMWAGWGIRTLAASEKRYNPIGYHLGTVWPHDNAIIAAGLRRYGDSAGVCRVLTALLMAAMQFHDRQLPECFSGFSREQYPIPVPYPVACHPQAWAAASVPFLLQSALGLEPRAFEGLLRVARPVLPEFVRELDFVDLRVGQGCVDLHFERQPDGSARAEVRRKEGDIEVEIDAPGDAPRSIG